MKRKTILLLLLSINLSLLGEDILNNTSSNIYKLKEKKAKKEAQLTKDSWINPLTIEGDYSKTKTIESNEKLTSKKASINMDQDIFKSGAIYKTIQKGELEITLNTTLVDQEKKQLLYEIYENVIELQKIDLEIKKLYYLIQNKQIEIEKNESSYTNGLLDISILDESIIELSELKNQKEDLSLKKIELLKEVKRYTNYNYKEIDLEFLSTTLLEQFLKNNYGITIKELELKQSKLNKDITISNYLPKVSLYGTYGYEDSQAYNKEDSYHNYGLKLSIPLDFNSNKTKEIAKLDQLVKKDQLTQEIKYETQFLVYIKESLAFLDNKIKNTNETIKRYENLYENANALYNASVKTIEDVQIMENRVQSSILDKKILLLDKKAILHKLYRKIQSY